MMKKYFKNFILCGEIDYHCILCAESFQMLEDLDKHIRWEKHRKLLKNQSYFPKLKKDSIYKIKNKYYYCELCNFITSSASNEVIKKHILEDGHKNNKSKPQNVGNKAKTVIPENYYGIICLGDKITLNSQQWHGLIDNKCLTCYIDIEDMDDHASSTDHMINLINSEIKLAKDHYYRKISEESAYCFTCKKTIPLQGIDDHSNRTEYYYLDRANDKATCRICGVTVHYDFSSLLNHRKIHDMDLLCKADSKHVAGPSGCVKTVADSSIELSVEGRPKEVGEFSEDKKSSTADDPMEAGETRVSVIKPHVIDELKKISEFDVDIKSSITDDALIVAESSADEKLTTLDDAMKESNADVIKDKESSKKDELKKCSQHDVEPTGIDDSDEVGDDNARTVCESNSKFAKLSNKDLKAEDESMIDVRSVFDVDIKSSITDDALIVAESSADEKLTTLDDAIKESNVDVIKDKESSKKDELKKCSQHDVEPTGIDDSDEVGDDNARAVCESNSKFAKSSNKDLKAEDESIIDVRSEFDVDIKSSITDDALIVAESSADEILTILDDAMKESNADVIKDKELPKKNELKKCSQHDFEPTGIDDSDEFGEDNARALFESNSDYGKSSNKDIKAEDESMIDVSSGFDEDIKSSITDDALIVAESSADEIMTILDDAMKESNVDVIKNKESPIKDELKECRQHDVEPTSTDDTNEVGQDVARAVVFESSSEYATSSNIDPRVEDESVIDVKPSIKDDPKEKPFKHVNRGKLRTEIKEYGQKHFITLNEAGKQGFCSLCHINIPAGINNFKEHALGKSHQLFLEFKGLVEKSSKPETEMTVYVSISLMEYVEEISMRKKKPFLLINGKLCITKQSFLLLNTTPNSKKTKCYICNEVYPDKDIEHFKLSADHKKKLANTEVVVSAEDEFVRVVQPGLFHCGFCNLLLPSWPLLERHFTCAKHLEAKKCEVFNLKKFKVYVGFESLMKTLTKTDAKARYF